MALWLRVSRSGDPSPLTSTAKRPLSTASGIVRTPGCSNISPAGQAWPFAAGAAESAAASATSTAGEATGSAAERGAGRAV